MAKGRILSGMRPTGKLHLGNYLGALDNWVRLQNDYECYFMVADWHALTTGYEDTSQIRTNTRELVIDWLSAGLDPEKNVIFVQSHVKEHAELQLLLSMITPLSWLERCPTFKEQLKQLEGRDISTHGFLGYPLLQAADIMIYKADTVPVGEDQLAHIELTREVVRRFNYLYGKVFPEPQPKLNKVTLLPGVDGRKMSKSYGNHILMAASEKEVTDTVKLMVTDPQRIRKDDPGHPDVCTVHAYHKIFSTGDIDTITGQCQRGEIGCVACKKNLSANLSGSLEQMREKRSALEANPGFIDEIINEGAKKARAAASVTLAEVREAMKI